MGNPEGECSAPHPAFKFSGSQGICSLVAAPPSTHPASPKPGPQRCPFQPPAQASHMAQHGQSLGQWAHVSGSLCLLNAELCQGHMLSGKVIVHGEHHCWEPTEAAAGAGPVTVGTTLGLCACRPRPRHQLDPPPSSWFSSVLWTPHPSAASTTAGSVFSVPKALWRSSPGFTPRHVARTWTIWGLPGLSRNPVGRQHGWSRV